MNRDVPIRRVIVLIPTRGIVTAELVQALVSNTEDYEIVLRMAHRRPVDVARNELAAAAIAAADDIALFSRADDPYVFWIDSDAFFVKGTLTLMLDALQRDPSIALLAALFGPRTANAGATAFRDRHDRHSYLIPEANVTRGELVDVEHVGLHMVVHRASLLRAVGVNPFGSETDRMTDDAAFCGRVRMVNGRIVVATGIPVFHVDDRTGTAYTPGIAACAIDGDAIRSDRLAEADLPVERRSYGERVDRAVEERERQRGYTG